MPTSPKALETSIYWQQHVFAVSKDPKQKARAQAAIARLQAQLDALKGKQ